MAPGRARVVLLAAALLLTVASTWWFGSREGWWIDPGEHGPVELGDPVALEAARPTADTRPQLIGTASPAVEAGEGGVGLTEVSVSIVAEGPGNAVGGTIVEAGEDWATLRECGVMSIGETRALTVRNSVRVWRARPFGRPSRFFEEATARHAPRQGPLTLRLARGRVSVHVKAVDTQGAPVAALAVELVGSAHPGVVLEGTTEEGGDVRWDGLTSAPTCAVRKRVGKSGTPQAKTWEVSWNEDRSQGTVTMRVHRERILRGRLVGPGAAHFDKVTFEGTVPGSESEEWSATVTRGEFALSVPVLLESIHVRPKRTFVWPPGREVVYVVPQTFTSNTDEPIELRTIHGVHVEGEVEDRAGRPVRNVVLSVHVRPLDRGAWERGSPGWFDEHVGSVFTDDQGRFRTNPSLPGLWIFSVQGDDESSIEIPDAVEVTGPGPTIVVLTLP